MVFRKVFFNSNLDKNNIVCNDVNERKEDLYVYNQFNEPNTSKLPTRKIHPFPCSKFKFIKYWSDKISTLSVLSFDNR